MPNISQENLEKLTAERDFLQLRVDEDTQMIRDLRNQVETFNEILDKITRAANGWSIVQDRNVSTYSYAAPAQSNYGYNEPHSCTPPTAEVIQARMIDDLFAKLVTLESKLAAVIAISSFAKEHKRL